jgi:hypothetical protein
MNRSTIFVLVDHLPDSSTTLDITEDGPLNADWVHWRVCLGACEAYVYSTSAYFSGAQLLINYWQQED